MKKLDKPTFQIIIGVLLLGIIATPVSAGLTFELIDQPLGETQGVFSGGLSAADADSDGDIDLAISGINSASQPELLVGYNSGNGYFDTFTEDFFSGPNNGLSSGDVAWSNYDGDSIPELIASGRDDTGSARLFDFEGTPSGTYTVNSEPLGVNKGLAQSSLSWAGGKYLAVSGINNSDTVKLMVLRNDTAGNFTGIDDIANSAEADFLSGVKNGALTWGDIDGTGNPDLIVTGEDSEGRGRAVVFHQNSVDTILWSDSDEFRSDGNGLVYGDLVTGDFTGDGESDLLATGRDNGGYARLILYKNMGSWLKKASEPWGIGKGLEYSALDAADYDRDGDSDFAVLGRDNDNDLRCLVFRNDGTVGFNFVREPLGTGEGLENGDLIWAELTGDTYPDLVVSGVDSRDRRRLLVFENNYTVSSEGDSGGSCLLGRLTFFVPRFRNRLRKLRDLVLITQAGRLLTSWYYPKTRIEFEAPKF